MSPRPTYNEVTGGLDGAEKGTLSIVLPPRAAALNPKDSYSHLDEKRNILTDSPPSLTSDNKIAVKLDATPPPPAKPKPKPKRPPRWIRWTVWFNTYRKLFTFCFSLNMVGLGLAASGVWTYPIHRPAPLVLGNLMTAILMRNEVFGRCLYLIVNTLFAKVVFHLLTHASLLNNPLVGSFMVAPWLHLRLAASWRYSFRLCTLWVHLASSKRH